MKNEKLNYPEIIKKFMDERDYTKEFPLCSILRESKSDKHSDWHNYGSVYDVLFNSLKDEKLNILEVGIMFGYSLYAWEAYFKNSNIYAGDINPEYFVNKGRVKSFYCNQEDSASIHSMLNNEELKDIEFDIIIDDGKHEYFPNYNLLENSIHKLKKGGIYVIEDLIGYTIERFESEKNKIKEKFNLEYVEVIKIPFPANQIDNNLVVIIK